LFVLLLLGLTSVVLPQNATNSPQREEGIRLYERGDFQSAVKILTAATKQDKTDAESWHLLGLALRHTGEHKKARKAFETAIRLQPSYTPSHIALADTLIALGKIEEADEEANRAILLSPTNAEAHFMLGKIDMRRSMCSHALMHADNAIKYDPQLGAAYLLKSQVVMCNVGNDSMIRPGAASSEFAARRKSEAAKFAEAASYVQKFIELAPPNEDVSIWNEQLETLKAYAQPTLEPGSPRTIYFAPEVATKVKLLEKPEPTYTPQARSAGVVGTVVLRAVFAADGTVKHVLVLRSLPLGLTQQSVAAAKQIKFLPATLDGKPVSMILQIEYNFNLY
jgi:TonB family protein